MATLPRTLAALFVVAIAAAACGKVASVEADGCRSDDDCASTTLNERCCSQCEPIAGTKRSIAARSDSCRGKGGANRCPRLDCPQIDGSAVCSAGRCTLAKR